MARLSVIIPTRDRPGPLAGCLRTLAASFPPDAEVIVVSDGGSLPLEDVLAPFVVPLRLRLLTVPHRGPAAARNRGLAVASGEIVAFTDDDCRPGEGWLEAIASAVASSPPTAAGGTTRNGLTTNAYADASQFILELVGRHDRTINGHELFFSSNNLAFPADALRRLGGFDETFRTAEDRDLCRRWQAAGFKLRHVATAVVEHDAQLDLRRFVRQFFAYGRGAAQFHAAGGPRSFRDSLRFHVRLPALARPEVMQRGLRGGFDLLALLLLWEVVNLCGFVRGAWTPPIGGAAAAARTATALEEQTR